MAGAGGGGGGGGAGGAAGGAGAAGAPGATTLSGPVGADGPPAVKAGNVEVIGADGVGLGTFGANGKPVPASVKFDKSAPGAPSSKDAPSADAGVRLESLGKGVSTADVDEKTNQVVIRRSGRVIERFADNKAIAEFSEAKKLSEVDRETLARLSELRQAEPAARAEAKRSLGPDAKAREPELVNVVAPDPDKARIRAEVQQNDAEVYVWVERQRKLREQQRVQPGDAAPVAATAAAAAAPSAPAPPTASPARPESRGDDTIEKESTFSSPNPRRVVPPEIGAQYLQVGEKYYNPNNTKTAAFVDRGDKLETPSSAPKTAEALVKIAEARGWEDLRVKGTEGFRREVWLEASVRGIHVDGYKPSEMDKAELERRDTFMRDQNSVEVRSEAFQKLSPEEGTRRDPSLANAYAVIQAAKAFAKERIPDKAQQSAFVESTQAKVVADLEAGHTTPTVNIRTAAPNREAEQSRDLDPRRDRER